MKMYGVLSGQGERRFFIKKGVRRLYFVSIMVTLYIELLYTKYIIYMTILRSRLF